MSSAFAVIFAILASLAAAGSSARLEQVSISGGGWTISADSETLQVSHESLGAVLTSVQLHLEGEREPAGLKNWTIERTAAPGLSIRTDSPRTAWLFELRPDHLRISCTSTAAFITAKAPAPGGRMVARILDPEGTPVTWVGTNEVQGGYGGTETINRSYLPARNSRTSFYALGQIAGSNLHSLFDRMTDTVIDFTDATRLQRNARDQDILDMKMAVPGNSRVRLIPDYYTKVLGVPYYVPFDDSYFARAPMVWGSWTSYYEAVKEGDIVRNTDWIASNLAPYGFEYVQLDDGYDRGKSGEHYWIEHWDSDKFPHGPRWLTDYIRSKGLRAGLWIVPNAYAGAAAAHPDWYVRDKQGKTILDYHTGALDSGNPAVLEFLRKEFTTLRDWGFDYYKFDGEYAISKYIPGADIGRLHDSVQDPLVAYRKRLAIIREAIGPRAFIEGCPAGTPLNGLGYMNSYFTGHDVYNSWQGMYALFSSINANAFLNHIVVYVMPGEGIEVGPTMTVAEAEKKRPPSVVRTARTREEPMMGFGATSAEARTIVTHVALTGVAYPIASVLPELPEERVRLLKMTLPTMPIFPVDLFSRGTDMQWDKFKHVTPDTYIHNYPEILDLKVNSRSQAYDVVGMTNWRSETAVRDLDLSGDLGLSSTDEYVAFDFWNQKLLGVFRNHLPVDIAPHDTRVILLHPLQDRPQLVGMSRHITGSYSLLELDWDRSQGTLRGSSQTVPGDPYSLWFHVPAGTAVSSVRATGKDGHELKSESELGGASLRIGLMGEKAPIDWEIRFAPRTGR